MDGGLSTTFQSETAVVRRRVFSFVSAVCRDFFRVTDVPVLVMRHLSVRNHVACVLDHRKITRCPNAPTSEVRDPNFTAWEEDRARRAAWKRCKNHCTDFEDRSWTTKRHVFKPTPTWAAASTSAINPEVRDLLFTLEHQCT